MEYKAKMATRRWWQSMLLSPSELEKWHIQPSPSGNKAQLRRCDSAEAAMLTEGFRALWLSLPNEITQGSDPKILLRWATIAAALVHVKPGSEKGIASEAGKKGDGDKSVVSELRFAQLQNAKTPEEFLRRIRRILQQLKGVVSPESLADDIEQWFVERDQFRPRKAEKRIIVRWAMDYYRAASSKK